MKTLDEVIEIMTACIKFDADCSECPVLTSCTGRPWRLFDEDALTYLKEYRDYQKQAETVIKSDYVPDVENKPLTWDELKQMEGKPVWVEFLRDGESFDEEWIIVKDINDVCMADTQGFAYAIDDYNADKGWQAYRKEREC